MTLSLLTWPDAAVLIVLLLAVLIAVTQWLTFLGKSLEIDPEPIDRHVSDAPAGARARR